MFNFIKRYCTRKVSTTIKNGDNIETYEGDEYYDIGYLPQQTSIFRGLSVYQNLLAIAQIVKKGEAEQKNIVEKLMAEFSITHLRDVKATALSGGERRRTEIARCLINNPKVLLLDEPFAGVDLLSIQDIKRLLNKLQTRSDPVSCYRMRSCIVCVRLKYPEWEWLMIPRMVSHSGQTMIRTSTPSTQACWALGESIFT